MINNKDLPSYYLKPGEFCFVREPSLILTVLGSCVMVTMICRRLAAGAACHPVLPVCPSADSCQPDKCLLKNKYVACVIPEMIRKFQDLGGRLNEVEVKMFGGSNMFSRNSPQRDNLQVGSKNVSMARLKIAEAGLTLKSFDVGGNRGRKIYFYTDSGDVWVKRFQAKLGIIDYLADEKELLTTELKKI
ncbi:MAG TPA: chemotaxis protein CheD [Desulfobulbaceae bacterium]|nr:chemotaxis protein CheD [Desulfobulbaceae bacterium]